MSTQQVDSASSSAADSGDAVFSSTPPAAAEASSDAAEGAAGESSDAPSRKRGVDKVDDVTEPPAKRMRTADPASTDTGAGEGGDDMDVVPVNAGPSSEGAAAMDVDPGNAAPPPEGATAMDVDPAPAKGAVGVLPQSTVDSPWAPTAAEFKAALVFSKTALPTCDVPVVSTANAELLSAHTALQVGVVDQGTYVVPIHAGPVTRLNREVFRRQADKCHLPRKIPNCTAEAGITGIRYYCKGRFGIHHPRDHTKQEIVNPVPIEWGSTLHGQLAFVQQQTPFVGFDEPHPECQKFRAELIRKCQAAGVRAFEAAAKANQAFTVTSLIDAVVSARTTFVLDAMEKDTVSNYLLLTTLWRIAHVQSFVPRDPKENTRLKIASSTTRGATRCAAALMALRMTALQEGGLALTEEELAQFEGVQHDAVSERYIPIREATEDGQNKIIFELDQMTDPDMRAEACRLIGRRRTDADIERLKEAGEWPDNPMEYDYYTGTVALNAKTAVADMRAAGIMRLKDLTPTTYDDFADKSPAFADGHLCVDDRRIGVSVYFPMYNLDPESDEIAKQARAAARQARDNKTPIPQNLARFIDKNRVNAARVAAVKRDRMKFDGDEERPMAEQIRLSLIALFASEDVTLEGWLRFPSTRKALEAACLASGEQPDTPAEKLRVLAAHLATHAPNAQIVGAPRLRVSNQLITRSGDRVFASKLSTCILDLMTHRAHEDALAAAVRSWNTRPAVTAARAANPAASDAEIGEIAGIPHPRTIRERYKPKRAQLSASFILYCTATIARHDKGRQARFYTNTAVVMKRGVEEGQEGLTFTAADDYGDDLMGHDDGF